MGFLKKIVGSRNDRILKSYQKILNEINSIGDELKSLTLEDFPKITEKLKKEYQAGKSLDDILPYAFAIVREASERVMKMRHFD